MNELKDYLILDTETTGTGKYDEVIELGIIDMAGNTVYHSLFKPSCPIQPKAEEIHGISLNDLDDAPKFSDEWHKIKTILVGKKILIYNAAFDLRLLSQTTRKYGFSEVLEKQATTCVMLSYAKYHGQINPQTGNYRWIKLELALQNEGISVMQTHRVIGDCLMTLALIKKIGKIW